MFPNFNKFVKLPLAISDKRWKNSNFCALNSFMIFYRVRNYIDRFSHMSIQFVKWKILHVVVIFLSSHDELWENESLQPNSSTLTNSRKECICKNPQKHSSTRTTKPRNVIQSIFIVGHNITTSNCCTREITTKNTHKTTTYFRTGESVKGDVTPVTTLLPAIVALEQ